MINTLQLHVYLSSCVLMSNHSGNQVRLNSTHRNLHPDPQLHIPFSLGEIHKMVLSTSRGTCVLLGRIVLHPSRFVAHR